MFVEIVFPVPELPDGTIYQQDGAPQHVVKILRTFLDEQFSAKWIGRGSSYITWPARSLDLIPPGFILLEFVEDQVYRTPVHDLVNLQEKIYAAVKNVTPQMHRYTWAELIPVGHLPYH